MKTASFKPGFVVTVCVRSDSEAQLVPVEPSSVQRFQSFVASFLKAGIEGEPSAAAAERAPVTRSRWKVSWGASANGLV